MYCSNATSRRSYVYTRYSIICIHSVSIASEPMEIKKPGQRREFRLLPERAWRIRDFGVFLLDQTPCARYPQYYTPNVNPLIGKMQTTVLLILGIGHSRTGPIPKTISPLKMVGVNHMISFLTSWLSSMISFLTLRLGNLIFAPESVRIVVVLKN